MEAVGQSSKLRLQVLYFSGFLDLFAVSMIMPLILPQALELGASPALAGVLGSVYGGLQLMSSPIVGRWSDGVSRQFSLLVCMICTGLGYTMLGVYSTIPAFFLSRFTLGCFKHSQTISKALLSDLAQHQSSSHNQPAALLGNFNSFSSIGFIVGPIVGGHMAETSRGFGLVACGSGIIFVANAALIWWTVPRESQRTILKHCKYSDLDIQTKVTGAPTSSVEEKVDTEELNLHLSRLFASFTSLNWAELWDLMLMRFFAGFSIIIYRNNFSVILKDKFTASPSTIGYMTSFSGIVAALSGFILGPVMQRYNNDNAKLLFHSTIFQTGAMVCLTLAPSLTLLLAALIPLNIVTSFSRVSATTLTVEAASHKPSQQRLDVSDEKYSKTDNQEAATGAVIGLGQSVMALARMSAPLVAGVSQELAGVEAPAYISVLSAGVAVIVMVIAGRGVTAPLGKMHL